MRSVWTEALPSRASPAPMIAKFSRPRTSVKLASVSAVMTLIEPMGGENETVLSMLVIHR